MTALTKTLSNSTFADATIPYRTFVDEGKRLIAVANSFHAQWAGRGIAIRSKSLLLYHLDTLELIGFVDELKFEVNDLSFHPTESIIAIGIGSYDGGAFFEGELLLWDYTANKVESILAHSREVVQCAFDESGDRLSFTVNPSDDLDRPDVIRTQYEIEFPIYAKLKLEDLKPISVNDHTGQFNAEEYRARHGNATRVLAGISQQRQQAYRDRHLIRDMVFISKDEIAVARNDATVDIWNIGTGTVKEVKLPGAGDCVQIFLNSTSHSLLVNLWTRAYQSEHTNILLSIDLGSFKVQEVAKCSHALSMSRGNWFLARQIVHSNKSKKDFVLAPDNRMVFEKRLGHYDLFNHYLRIDNSELLYFLIGNPKEQYQNKVLCTLNPETFEIKEVWPLERQPNHYNDLNGIMVEGNLILSGKVYASSRSPYGAHELFCIDLAAKQEKWLRTVGSQVGSFGLLDNGATVVMALANGQLELIESATGKTIEVISRSKAQSFAAPLSLATLGNTIAVGLANGEIEIFAR